MNHNFVCEIATIYLVTDLLCGKKETLQTTFFRRYVKASHWSRDPNKESAVSKRLNGRVRRTFYVPGQSFSKF